MPTSLPELYLHEIRISTAVLQFDISAGYGLTVWRWPVNEAGERVPPSELSDHRLSHRFLGPCCICPALTDGEFTFTEAAIFMATSGRRLGQYLARCARDSCGYFIPLENVYPKLGVPLRLYPRRAFDEVRPEPVVYLGGDIVNENHNGNSNVGLSRTEPAPLRRSYATADIRHGSLLTVRRPQESRRRKPPLHLLQLHSAVRPGLSEKDFRSLFARCACGLIMTRSAFRSHYCASERVEPDVIATTDSEGEVIEITDPERDVVEITDSDGDDSN